MILKLFPIPQIAFGFWNEKYCTFLSVQRFFSERLEVKLYADGYYYIFFQSVVSLSFSSSQAIVFEIAESLQELSIFFGLFLGSDLLQVFPKARG